MSITKKSVLIIILVLLVDQVVKIVVKTHMFLYQDFFIIGHWFDIKFIENNGMAFGFDFPGDYGKVILSLFRIVAVIAIGIYLRHLIQQKSHPGLVICVSLILAGALGNIIDSAFYGLIFSESTQFTKAVLFPQGGGYAGFLHGKVVDMLYFPVLRGTWPEWVPFKGGQSFEFFRPVFNLADSSITIGVFSILIFQKKFFAHRNSGETTEETLSESDIQKEKEFIGMK